MPIDYTRGDSPVYDGFRENWMNAEIEELKEYIERLEADIDIKLEALLKAEDENARLAKELATLAIESVTREKQLAKLEAEVQHWAGAEKDGRLVVLPPKSKYGNGDLNEAIRRASHMCSVTNNDVTRITLDALIDKQIREETKAEPLTLCLGTGKYMVGITRQKDETGAGVIIFPNPNPCPALGQFCEPEKAKEQSVILHLVFSNTESIDVWTRKLDYVREMLMEQAEARSALGVSE